MTGDGYDYCGRYLNDAQEFASPFRHWTVTDFLRHDNWVVRAIADEFPPPDDPGWHTFTGPLEQGKQEGSAEIAGPLVAAVHDQLARLEFVDALRALTGIPDLVADPDRVGGGIHQSGPGARLGMHVDFNLHPTRPRLVRAINVILFLDDGTTDDVNDGGWLWMERPGGSGKIIRPRAGLLVVFEANDDNYHGHPIPLADDAPLRRSIPAYYYRPVRDGETIEAHSTRFLET